MSIEQNNSVLEKRKKDQIEVDPNISVKILLIEIKTKKKKFDVRETNIIQWKKIDKSIINTTTTKAKSEEYTNHYLQ